jgi:O-antigen/teichoic acid export membrane protein
MSADREALTTGPGPRQGPPDQLRLDGPFPDPEPVDDLRGSVVRGVGWKLVTQVATAGTRVIFGITLAHLLTPHEYGLAGMALVFTGLATIFVDPSLGSALIQRRTISELDRSTVFWTNLALGILCTVIGVLTADAVAGFFSQPDVAPLFAVISLNFTINALSSTQIALLTRSMEWRTLEVREMASVGVGSILAVALAFAGFGAWAIVGQFVCTGVVSAILLWTISTWRPRFLFSLASLTSLGSFGISLFFSRILAYLNGNADNLLVGRYLGTTSLGVYSVAYNVMFAPIARISQPIGQVMFAALSRVQDDSKRLGNAWLKSIRLSSTVAVPAFVGMLVVAPDFVPVVLGDRWHDAVPVLQLLCVAGIAESVAAMNPSLLVAKGRGATLLRFMIFSTILTVGGFGVGLIWGLIGVTSLYAATRVIVLPVFTKLACDSIGMAMLEWFRNLRTVAEVSAGMGIVVYLARLGLVHEGVPAWARLAILVVLGVAVYLALLWWRAPDVLAEVRRLRSRKSTPQAEGSAAA